MIKSRTDGITSGGGRVSIYADDWSGFIGNNHFIDKITTGTEYQPSSGSTGGAGTAFVKHPNQNYGHLFVDNNNRVSISPTTPIRRVGSHVITDISQVGTTNEWIVTIGSNLWKEH